MSRFDRRVLTAAAAIVLAACAPDDSAVAPGARADVPDPAVIARDYESLEAITPEPVYTNPGLAMSCIGASRADVEAARVTHGPHANTAVRIFMDERAAASHRDGTRPFPVGAIVVKEKLIMGFREDGQWTGRGNGVGGMIKREPGYDPTNGDWEYFYVDDDTPLERGRIASCVGCHRTAAHRDHVFGKWGALDRK